MRKEIGKPVYLWAMPWHVYLLRCGDGSLYTGVTTDLPARLAAHRAGRGAAYTRGRGPLELVHAEPAESRSAALRRELQIKRMNRNAKEAMVATEAKRAAKRVATRTGAEAAPAEGFRGFGPGALTFFRQLARRNEREWFEAHRRVWEREVRDPMRALVEELDVRLAAVAPELVGDPRRSLFRIHRDTRFSRDKRPYKTHAACWLYHRDAGHGVGDSAQGGAGLYLHLAPAPEGSMVAGGLWMPPAPALAKVRERLAEDHEELEAILRAPAFRRRFGSLSDEAVLKRMPRGFDAEHPAAALLRYRSFTVSRELAPDEVLSPKLPATLARDFAALTPFVRWLNAAIGYQAAERR
jgi:uncharacterized protein (TIGR02453 family)